MTTDQLENSVWELIDSQSMDFSKQDWIEFLQSLSDNATIRAEAAIEEQKSDENEGE